jgi:hypothetical protein
MAFLGWTMRYSIGTTLAGIAFLAPSLANAQNCYRLPARRKGCLDNQRGLPVNDKHDDDLLPNDPDESHYTPVSYIKVSESTEILDFTLSLRTTDGGVFRFRLTPNSLPKSWRGFRSLPANRRRALKRPSPTIVGPRRQSANILRASAQLLLRFELLILGRHYGQSCRPPPSLQRWAIIRVNRSARPPSQKENPPAQAAFCPQSTLG